MEKIISVFSSRKYIKEAFTKACSDLNLNFRFNHINTELNENTVLLAKGSDAVCLFVNDQADFNVLLKLNSFGINNLALRCAGFNNVDLNAAKEFKIKVCRVPSYSPHAIAEHAVCLILALNRKLKKSIDRVREQNFEIDGLLGFDLFGKTVGIVGAGKIGTCTAQILNGFGCKILYYDPYPNKIIDSLGGKCVDLDSLYSESDIISLHCGLDKNTTHLINSETIKKMKDGVMLINTSRGGLIDSKAVIQGFKTKKIGYLGMDVYEKEDDLFFHDHSENIIQDDIFNKRAEALSIDDFAALTFRMKS